jgi:hypothetical protein
MISNQIAGMALVFGLAQFIKYFNLANPKNALVIRITYGSVQILSLVIFAYIRSQIMKRKGKNNEYVTIVTPPRPFSEEEPKTERLTVEEYDNRELYKVIQSTVFGAFLLILIHIWLGALQPLIFQSILPLKTLFTSNLFQIYVLGKKAEGKLERPWKEPSPFADLFQIPNEEANTHNNDDDEGEPTGIVEINDEDNEEGLVESHKESEKNNVSEDDKKSSHEEEQPLLKQRNINSNGKNSNNKKAPRKDL